MPGHSDISEATRRAVLTAATELEYRVMICLSNPLLAALRQKIYRYSTLLPLANSLADQHQSRVVARLAQAIRDRRQVQLLRYYSANSNVRGRVGEFSL